jgi:hypothetical protein
MGDRLIHADLSHRIIGAAMTVLNELKPGLDEKIYENALCIELRHLGGDWFHGRTCVEDDWILGKN